MPTLNQLIRNLLEIPALKRVTFTHFILEANHLERKIGFFMYMYMWKVESATFHYFSSVQLIKALPTEVKALLFIITKCLLIMIGYFLFNELFKAVSQFLPSFSGSASSMPPIPDPSGNTGIVAAATGILIQDEIDQESIWQNLDAQEQLIEPLMSDSQRRIELEEECDRMIYKKILKPLSRSERKNMLEMQFACDKKIEKALRSDGYGRETILSFRRDWRRAAFSPNSRPTFIKSTAMRKTMAKHSDIKTSPYYRRIVDEIKSGGIPMKKGD